MSKRNDQRMKGTPNSPNPAKFLRELKQIVPALERGGHIPPNRFAARAMGEQSALQSSPAKVLAEAKEGMRRNETVGRWFDRHMSELAPWTFSMVSKTQKPFIFLLMGYTMLAESGKETIDDAPDIECTICVIRRFGRIVKAERLIWQDPRAGRKGLIIHE